MYCYNQYVINYCHHKSYPKSPLIYSNFYKIILVRFCYTTILSIICDHYHRNYPYALNRLIVSFWTFFLEIFMFLQTSVNMVALFSFLLNFVYLSIYGIWTSYEPCSFIVTVSIKESLLVKGNCYSDFFCIELHIPKTSNSFHSTSVTILFLVSHAT